MEFTKFGLEYFTNQKNRNVMRKIIRKLYYKNILRFVIGKSVDFGCGAGYLLSYLPEDSIGLEVNKSAVAHGTKENLRILYYNGDEDSYSFSILKKDVFHTFICLHVFEHFNCVDFMLSAIFKSLNELNIRRIIIAVPGGSKGYLSDLTHKCFLKEDYFYNPQFLKHYKIIHCKYFPVNLSWVGNYFAHNELVVVYDKKQ